MKDNEIIGLYWERNEAAITASADKYGDYCHSISYNILHNNEDAEECVNDTWLGAWSPCRRNAQNAYQPIWEKSPETSRSIVSRNIPQRSEAWGKPSLCYPNWKIASQIKQMLSR